MKIFVAGASGALGRQLVPLLADAGHEVLGTTTSPQKLETLRALGAQPVVLDLLDAEAVGRAISEAEPEVVVHEATALSGIGGSLRKFDETFAQTNRLRTEGTDNLLAAALAVGARKLVAQSYAGWTFAREGAAVKDEDAALDSAPASNAKETIAAIRYLEDRVLAAKELDGIILRYGGFYGPGTSFAEDGESVEAIRKRAFPIVGDGGGMASFIHIEDAARATFAAIERGRRGIYNIVDDDPAPVSAWLPYAASAVGAKPPRHVPYWLGKLFAGEMLATMMVEGRGASNAKAKRELDWQPLYASWREGFVNGLKSAA
ncbi:MAG TPA: NAD(P)-dependent oxidoreductase [Gaiellaceae bacterium]|nr:NAD(P)-dependent oxidoreductase [Gaiellaceae bacterium]